MGKKCCNEFLDAALNYLKTNGSTLVVCKGEPDTYANAISTVTYQVGIIAYTTGSGDYTGPADSTVAGGGRMLTMAGKSGIVVNSTGVADHVAMVDADLTTLIYVTTCTSQTVNSTSNTLTVSSWVISIADPT
jgi:hypothetical protein